MLVSPVEIPLTQGFVAFVDEQDAHLKEFRWWPKKDKYTTYACARINGKMVTMHRLIMDFPEKPINVDHIDRNGLNNCRSNLRLVTNSLNQANKRKQKNSSSVFKGVSRVTGYDTWYAEGRYEGKRFYLGSFKVEEEAALAYDDWALETFGEHANLNFPQSC